MSKLASDFRKTKQTADSLDILGSTLLAVALLCQLVNRKSAFVLFLVFFAFGLSVVLRTKAFRLRNTLLSLDNPERNIEIASRMRLNSLFFSRTHAHYWRELFQYTTPQPDEVLSEVVRFISFASKGEYLRESARVLVTEAISFLGSQSLSKAHQYILSESLSRSVLQEDDQAKVRDLIRNQI